MQCGLILASQSNIWSAILHKLTPGYVGRTQSSFLTVTSLAIAAFGGHFLHSLKALALIESAYNTSCQSSIVIPQLTSNFVIQDETGTHLKQQLPAT